MMKMELVCEKYNETVGAAAPKCRHPEEYCKYRMQCMIHFLDREESQRNKGKELLRFDKGNGLLPAIAQDANTGEILMLAYINDEAWDKTLTTGKAHYWSRSRNKLWLKGETSGHYQVVKEILVDCDSDTVVFKVEQLGGATCHEGYRSCFFRRLEEGGDLSIKDTRVFDPGEVYKK